MGSGFGAWLCRVQQIRVGESVALSSGREPGLGGSVLLPSHSFPKLVIFSSSVALGRGAGTPWESRGRDAGGGGDTEQQLGLLVPPPGALCWQPVIHPAAIQPEQLQLIQGKS